MTTEDIEAVQTTVRERLIRLFVRRGCIEPDEAKKMLAWKHGGGFSVDASVRIEARDRAGLDKSAGSGFERAQRGPAGVECRASPE